jgi:hypothetical protein
VFILPGLAESARPALTDVAVINSDPFFRPSIAEAEILGRSLRFFH